MRKLGETVGIIDSDDDEEAKMAGENKETPEDTLNLPDAERHRREMLAKKKRLKDKRKLRIAGGATGGAIVGGIILAPVFPLGMALGGAAGGAITKTVHKHHEKKKLKKLDKKLMAQNQQKLKIDNSSGIS